MAITTSHSMLTTLLFLFLLIVSSLDSTFGLVGVCFGRVGDNLPSVQTTIAMYKRYNIRSMRLYDPHRPTLRALSGTGIRLMLGVSTDRHLRNLANCPDAATAWVRTYILRYPNVSFRYIAVGNEVDPDSDMGRFVLPAMQNIYRAILAARLGSQIKVSTSIKTNLLETSYPPQAGEFKCSVNWYIRPIVEFLRETQTVLLANIYPYFAYINDRRNINLYYALLEPNSGVVAGGVYYDNLYYAILDAVEAAMDRLLAASPPPSRFADEKQGGGGGGGSSGAVGSETGWSTRGGDVPPACVDGDGPAESVRNARIHNNNLMRILNSNAGTPRRPGRRLETYIFAMFDEDLKPSAESERHFGIFSPDGEPKYPLVLR